MQYTEVEHPPASWLDGGSGGRLINFTHQFTARGSWSTWFIKASYIDMHVSLGLRPHDFSMYESNN